MKKSISIRWGTMLSDVIITPQLTTPYSGVARENKERTHDRKECSVSQCLRYVSGQRVQSKIQVVQVYDRMMHYCTLKGKPIARGAEQNPRGAIAPLHPLVRALRAQYSCSITLRLRPSEVKVLPKNPAPHQYPTMQADALQRYIQTSSFE